MSSLGVAGPRLATAAATETATEATRSGAAQENATRAAEFPPGMVSVERSGLKLATQIAGGVAGIAGAALIGISLLSRGTPGAEASRLLAAPLLVGGGLVAAGGGAAVGAELIPPTRTFAAHTGYPTRAQAQLAANEMVGRQTEVIKDVGGTFAIVDKGPVATRSSWDDDWNSGHYHGDGHGHRHHYYGDGHDHHHPHHYHEPYYPSYPDYFPSYPSYPSYPSHPGGGYTSPGDDYDRGGSSWPSNGGGTSPGDDYGNGGGYDPPPSTYDPPSSYDPPSYDYGGGSGSSNSSSNGNPSDDDF